MPLVLADASDSEHPMSHQGKFDDEIWSYKVGIQPKGAPKSLIELDGTDPYQKRPSSLSKVFQWMAYFTSPD